MVESQNFKSGKNMDRLDELAVLVAIIETGSLKAAGHRLRLSPPTVTRALSALEERVGVRLVQRTTRRLSATDAGRELAERATWMLAEYEECMDGDASGPVGGAVRLTAPLAFGRRHVTPIVTEFLSLHPKVQIDLVLNDRNVDLIGENLQLAVRIGELADSSLVIRRVGEVRRVLVATPDYLARRGAPATPADLAQHDIILSTAASNSTEWRFEQAGRTQVVRLAPRLRINEVESILIAVRAGQGVARALSYQVADDLAAGRLVRLLPEHEPAPLPVQLVLPNGRHTSRAVRALFDHMVLRFGQLEVIRPGRPQSPSRAAG